MTLYEFIQKNFEEDEPFFISELPGDSVEETRKELRRLIREGKIIRIQNGVYYQSYVNDFGDRGKPSFRIYIEKKYLNPGGVVEGYRTGLTLLNDYGFSSQNPAVIEIASNKATAKMREMEFSGRRFIVYKPVLEVNEKNVSALCFLDLVLFREYIELKGNFLKKRFEVFIERAKVDFDQVKACLPYYPDKVYRIIYDLGLMPYLL